MPWNDWVYTIPAAATDAFSGKVIASADWNNIFTDIQTALNQLASGTYVNSIGIVVSVTGNAAIPIVLPTGFTKYLLDSVYISSLTVGSATAANVALYTAANATGTQIITSTGITITAAGANAGNTVQKLIPSSASTYAIGSSVTPLYFTVLVAASVSSTANVTLRIVPLP